MMGVKEFNSTIETLTQDVKTGHRRHSKKAEAAMVIHEGEPIKGTREHTIGGLPSSNSVKDVKGSVMGEGGAGVKDRTIDVWRRGRTASNAKQPWQSFRETGRIKYRGIGAKTLHKVPRPKGETLGERWWRRRR